MLRRRPRRTRHGVEPSPFAGWLVLSVLYLVAVGLNVLLAVRVGAVWPACLAAVLAVAGVGSVLAARRR